MFFDSAAKIRDIAAGCGSSIFVVPDGTEIDIKNAFILEPTDKTTITIEQVREILAKLSAKQQKDQFIIIRPADKLGPESANALLKNLEEPGDKIHFVLITSQLSRLLPTILSRANIYILSQHFSAFEISATDEEKALAKRLISAKPKDLVAVVNEITGKKEKVRSRVLGILSVAIEMLYKSYLLNPKSAFMTRLTKLITTYDNIMKKGNIKLQLVANLI